MHPKVPSRYVCVCVCVCVRARASLVAQHLRILLPMQGRHEFNPWVDPLEEGILWRSSLEEDPLEEGMASHSGILVRKIPWTQEPGRLQSMSSQRVKT